MSAARLASTVDPATAAVLRVGVGSTNAAKVQAVRTVFRRLKVAHRLRAEHISSGVSEQPVTEEETIRGALQRTTALLASTDVELAIGFEGGVDRTLFGTFACEWCVVQDRTGTIGFGGGQKILLPDLLAERVARGETLGTATQEWAVGHSIASRGGIFGLLTRDVVKRESVNAQALLLALARFLGAPFYADKQPNEVAELLARRLDEHFAHRRHPPAIGEQLSLGLH